jgi:hypothetical protein
VTAAVELVLRVIGDVVFHMNVATRSPAPAPSPRSAFASRAASSLTSPNVIERIPSPVHVDTVASDWNVEAYRSKVASESGSSCIVLSMDNSFLAARRPLTAEPSPA